LLVGAGGLVSFGHAAYFGLGAYGAALALHPLGFGMAPALLAGMVLAFFGALVFGWFCVRLSGVYFAMLTLAFAQIVWSVAFQWTEVTGGDNGLIGVWPSAWAASATHFYWLTLILVVVGIALLRVILFSPFGYALRALRDSELRADAIGLSRHRIQWIAFAIAGGFAGLAGALYAFLKGSVFPDNLGIPLSIDGLAMVLLGGVGTVSGGIVGAALYKTLSIWMISHTDYSKLVIGALIVVLVSLFPQGVLGALARWRRQPVTGKPT
jgi:branched-chain amino acid transport system permease protein